MLDTSEHEEKPRSKSTGVAPAKSRLTRWAFRQFAPNQNESRCRGPRPACIVEILASGWTRKSERTWLGLADLGPTSALHHPTRFAVFAECNVCGREGDDALHILRCLARGFALHEFMDSFLHTYSYDEAYERALDIFIAGP